MQFCLTSWQVLWYSVQLSGASSPPLSPPLLGDGLLATAAYFASCSGKLADAKGVWAISMHNVDKNANVSASRLETIFKTLWCDTDSFLLLLQVYIRHNSVCWIFSCLLCLLSLYTFLTTFIQLWIVILHNSKPGCNIHTKDFLKCGLVSFVFDCGDDDYLINGVESGVRGVVE